MCTSTTISIGDPSSCGVRRLGEWPSVVALEFDHGSSKVSRSSSSMATPKSCDCHRLLGSDCLSSSPCSSFNFPGYPSIGLRSLTPSVPSIAGSHHASSTWPPGLFPSGPLTPRLTIDQANSIFGLASECQVLGLKLAKEFHVLSGLEAIHHNSIQGTPHETLTLGCSAREAAYLAILWDDITEAECEATTHHLCSEVDAAWKEMHKVMYNHQLDYDW